MESLAKRLGLIFACALIIPQSNNFLYAKRTSRPTFVGYLTEFGARMQPLDGRDDGMSIELQGMDNHRHHRVEPSNDQIRVGDTPSLSKLFERIRLQSDREQKLLSQLENRRPSLNQWAVWRNLRSLFPKEDKDYTSMINNDSDFAHLNSAPSVFRQTLWQTRNLLKTFLSNNHQFRFSVNGNNIDIIPNRIKLNDQANRESSGFKPTETYAEGNQSSRRHHACGLSYSGVKSSVNCELSAYLNSNSYDSLEDSYYKGVGR